MNKYVEYLKSNQIGIIPHDTIPGIVARMTTENAEKILSIKERSKNKGFIILIPNKEYLTKLTKNILPTTKEILEKYWPGALTIIFHKDPSVPKIISGTDTTVAIRYPKHPLLNKILESLNEPVITTSANISNQTKISKELLTRIDFCHPKSLEPLTNNHGSTIIDGTKENLPTLRQGGILIAR